MKSKNLMFPRNLVITSSAVMAALAPLSASATTFTWDGGDAASNSWTAANNWNPDVAPTFDNTADLVFDTLTRPTGFIANNTTVKSLAFGANVDGPFAVRLVGFSPGQVAQNLTFDADSGNATVTVDADATGNINIGLAAGDTGSTYGNPILADNLVVNHGGSGLLLFNRPFQAGAFSITKNGGGTMQTNNNNLLTGALNINAGILIANTFDTNGLDLNNFSAINLGGGTLEIRPFTNGTAGATKTYATVPVNVNTASTLTFNNTTATNYTAQFTGSNAFAINADLTFKNTSATTTLTNGFNFVRALTGSGDILVETYNNITASGDNFGLGRLFLNANNASWSGDLTISRGTVSLGGNAVNAAGTGKITLGTTSDAFGAGLTFFPGGGGGSTVTYTNNITVTGGVGSGFRAIKGAGTNHSVTFSGNVVLNGNLTLDHTWSTTDRRLSLNGQISGGGGLTITRVGGSAGTTVVLNGACSYTGPTTVAAGASFSTSRTCSLTSNITVATGARIGGTGSTTGSLTLDAGAKYFFFFSAGYAPMNVSGAVTIDSSFDINSGLVGGSQGEAIPWANVAPGTYTLISGTSSTFNTITNFGVATQVVDVGGVSGKNAYFQNGGGTSGGGLQLVVTGPSLFDDWKTTNGTTGGFQDDHDSDGVENGVEYYLKGNVVTTGFTALPGVVDTAGVRSVTWTAASISAGYAGVYGQHFTVETSDTLAPGSWVTAPIGTGPDTVSIPFAAATAVRNVKYTFPTTGPKKFARLKVTGP
jgi:autotransporter-associated beta strand protein